MFFNQLFLTDSVFVGTQIPQIHTNLRKSVSGGKDIKKSIKAIPSRKMTRLIANYSHRKKETSQKSNINI